MKQTVAKPACACSLIAFSVACFCTTSAAASLPTEFQGVWTSHSSNKCTHADWKGVASSNDNLISTSKDAIEFFEAGCSIRNSYGRQGYETEAGTAYETEVDLSCSGYGMTWRTRELWHVRTLKQRKVLITVLLKTYFMRDDLGKPVKSNTPTQRVQTYLECE